MVRKSIFGLKFQSIRERERERGRKKERKKEKENHSRHTNNGDMSVSLRKTPLL